MRYLLLISLFWGLFTACDKAPNVPNSNNNGGNTTNLTHCEGSTILEDNVYQKDGKTYLWAGEDSTTHFDISGWSLNVCQLIDHSYDREAYDALITPLFSPIADNLAAYPDNEQVIVVHGNTETKVFPYSLMTFHEAINDVVDGEPIMIAYCLLADLAAVYTRDYCGQTLTFGVSGYTYADENIWDGLDGFILWDRETESLWWPQLNIGVSGIMESVYLEKHPNAKWSISTWGTIKTDYPDAKVLQSNQSMTPPDNWPRYAEDELDCG